MPPISQSRWPKSASRLTPPPTSSWCAALPTSLPAIAKQFEAELNDRLGFIDAAITSARELSVQERQGLETQVARMTGRTVRAQYSTDPAVLGGAVVQIGSTVYDGSVRGQLHRIREQLVQT